MCNTYITSLILIHDYPFKCVILQQLFHSSRAQTKKKITKQTSNNQICEGFTCIFTSPTDCSTVLYIFPSVCRKIWNLNISVGKSYLCCHWNETHNFVNVKLFTFVTSNHVMDCGLNIKWNSLCLIMSTLTSSLHFTHKISIHLRLYLNSKN